MTAKELRLKDEGIQVTGFEAPRRIFPELARQQCGACLEECHNECVSGECDTLCDSDCWDQCVMDPGVQASYIAHPRAVSTSTAQNRTWTIVKVDVY